jgi:hypothetical protein
MANSLECRRQWAECRLLAGTEISLEAAGIIRNMGKSWLALANQMDRLDERDHALAVHLALAR